MIRFPGPQKQKDTNLKHDQTQNKLLYRIQYAPPVLWLKKQI